MPDPSPDTAAASVLTDDEARSLLARHRCCAAPSICGARCMDDAESHEMEQFVGWVDRQTSALDTARAEVEERDRRLAAVTAERDAALSVLGPRKAGAMASLVSHATELVQIERDDARATIEQMQTFCELNCLATVRAAFASVPAEGETT